jgi:hypothetical protein
VAWNNLAKTKLECTFEEEKAMKPLLLGMVLFGLFTMPVSASPLISVSMSGMEHLTACCRDIVEVKKWGTPPGWSRGRKVGWRGLGMPPGQAKKMWR